MFLDRERELQFLERRYGMGGPEFIVIYGRRRVGKTALLLEFISRHGGIYLLARETSNLENLKRFSDRLSEYFGDDFLKRNPFQNWDAFLEYLNQKATERLVVVIDEFPYLVKGDRSLPSILQEYWDLKLSNGRIFLIICGSSISMMEKLLGYKSPIYGRRTGQINLKPVDFLHAREFLPGYSLEDFIKAYGILGGSPAHLLEFDDSKTIKENLLEYLRSDSLLYQDAFFVLREELEEPRNYFAIMEAVAAGKTSLGEIMNETGLSRATVAKYLSVLIELDFVKREIPITASRKSRRGRYYIKDNYFAFWFRYIHPNIDFIESERRKELLELIIDDLPNYLGGIFENVAIEFLPLISNKLPFKPLKIGRWWHKNEEIDLVAFNEKEEKAILIEVKWKTLNKIEANKILKDLNRKSKILKMKEWEQYHGIIAKRVKDKEKIKGGLIWDLEDIENLKFSPE